MVVVVVRWSGEGVRNHSFRVLVALGCGRKSNSQWDFATSATTFDLPHVCQSVSGIRFFFFFSCGRMRSHLIFSYSGAMS